MRNKQKNEKIKWKKPEVKTYGDAVEIICGSYDDLLSETKDYGSTDGYTFNGQAIGTG